MNNTDKIELLKYNISRFDHYYASTNFKASLFMIGNITILGFLLTNKDKINEVAMLVSFLLVVITLVFVLLAIRPYLETYKGSKGNIFFGDISNNQEFKNNIETLEDTEYLQDLINQNKILADGLYSKFNLLNLATIFFIINIIFYLFIIIFN